MSDTTEKTLEERQRDEDTRAAIAIVRMIDDLEKADPQRTRHIEMELIWAVARRAGWSGYGADFMRWAHRAVMAGEDARREEEARAKDNVDPNLPQPTTETVGHA